MKEKINADGIQVSESTAKWVKLIYELNDFYAKVSEAYGNDEIGEQKFQKEMDDVLSKVAIILDKKLTESVLDVMALTENRMII